MWYDFPQRYTHTNESKYLLIKIITSKMYTNGFISYNMSFNINTNYSNLGGTGPIAL